MFTPLAPSGQGWLNPLNRGCKCRIRFGGRLRCHILARRLPRRPKRRHTRLPKQHYRLARAASGVNPGSTTHTLRHAYATHLLEEGVSLREISTYLA